jgi:DNA-binding transcriptional regulator YiaG
MIMGIREKLANASINSWLVDSLSDDERKVAEFIAMIAVSIQEQRRAQGMTQKELAEKLGVSQAMVSQWENGEENFTAATIVRISSALGLQLCNPISA